GPRRPDGHEREDLLVGVDHARRLATVDDGAEDAVAHRGQNAPASTTPAPLGPTVGATVTAVRSLGAVRYRTTPAARAAAPAPIMIVAIVPALRASLVRLKPTMSQTLFASQWPSWASSCFDLARSANTVPAPSAAMPTPPTTIARIRRPCPSSPASETG